MTCESARDWLLDAEKPANVESAPAPIAEHVAGCAQCRKLAQELGELEEHWRQRPLPARAETAKVEFLKRLDNRPLPAPRKPARPRWTAVRYLAVAASIFVIGGACLLFLVPEQRVEARQDVIDQLIEWNLELSEADTPAERQRIYAERQKKLENSVDKAKLNSPDRDMAATLLANGSWLAQNQDPVEELERFNQMADDVLEQVKTSSTSDSHRATRFAKQFRKINERGIDPTMERVRALAGADASRRKLINRILKHDERRADQINTILEKSPDITKKELREALDLSQKRHKHKKEL
jgi:hypothetical protein